MCRPNFIDYLNLRLRYNYFRLGKTNVRHIGIFLPIATSNITVIGVLFRIMLPNFVQIGPPAAEWWRYVQFQDGGCGGLILLPVSYKMMSLSSEGQSLSANQMSSTCLNPRLRYTYFRYGKTNARHTEILLCDFDQIAAICDGVVFWIRFQMSPYWKSAILEIFWLRLRPYHSNQRATMH